MMIPFPFMVSKMTSSLPPVAAAGDVCCVDDIEVERVRKLAKLLEMEWNL